jgi:hypothetical protein
MKTPLRFLLTLLCAAVASLQSVDAITVNSTADPTESGKTTLRDALAAVSDGETISFNVTTPATITLTSGQLEVGKSITISGPGADQLSVNGSAASRVFHILSGKTVSISGLTITNGSDAGGGGIYNDHATLTVTNSILSGNLAQAGRFAGGLGGGIANDGSSGSAALAVNDSTLSGNSATILGGAIYNDGSSSGSATVTVTNSILSGNSAAGTQGEGGGIYNDGFDGSATVTVTNSTLSGNSATILGGGIYNDGESDGMPSSATLTVSHSTLSGNSAPNGGFGGGIYNDGGNGSATLTISSSTVSGNSASAGEFGGGSGGGILNDGSFSGSAMLTINNSTLSGNSAVFGGGIFNGGEGGSATLTINNSTLSGDSASSGEGGGIYNDGGGTGGAAPVMIGSTILNAGSGSNIYNFSGTVTSQGYNLSSDGGVTNVNGGTGSLNNTGDQPNTIPMLGPLANNGGPTFTHALLTGSPAIDKGKNFIAATTDQRGTGFARTVDFSGIPNATGGDGTDIGAFEVQAPPVCPEPQGYWKNNPNAWPVSSLMLGSSTYTKTQLLTILGMPIGTGPKADASLILADQLIAAKLNIGNGADGTPVTSVITDADAVLSLYGGSLPYHVRTNTTNGQRMVNDANVLNNYNNGALTSGCGL